MTKQYISQGGENKAEKSAHLMTTDRERKRERERERERERGRDQSPSMPPQGHTLNSSSRPHLLKVSLPLNTVTGWGPSL
jgi:hypothetical protein